MEKSNLIRAASRIALARGQPGHRQCLVREIVALAEAFAADDSLTIPNPPRWPLRPQLEDGMAELTVSLEHIPYNKIGGCT